VKKRHVLHDLQIDVNNVVAGLFDQRHDPAFARASKLADELAAEIATLATRRPRP